MLSSQYFCHSYWIRVTNLSPRLWRWVPTTFGSSLAQVPWAAGSKGLFCHLSQLFSPLSCISHFFFSTWFLEIILNSAYSSLMRFGGSFPLWRAGILIPIEGLLFESEEGSQLGGGAGWRRSLGLDACSATNWAAWAWCLGLWNKESAQSVLPHKLWVLKGIMCRRYSRTFLILLFFFN